MARQNPVERAEASQGRLDARQKTATTNLNNRTNNARSKLNTRDSRQINQLVGDLTDLGPELPPPTLRKEEPRGPIPAGRGYVERSFQPGTGEGGTAGIASPLTEGATSSADTPVFDREFYGQSLYYGNDYLIAVEMRPLKRIRMRDANGASVELHFAEPGA